MLVFLLLLFICLLPLLQFRLAEHTGDGRKASQDRQLEGVLPLLVEKVVQASWAHVLVIIDKRLDALLVAIHGSKHDRGVAISILLVHLIINGLVRKKLYRN